MYRVSSECLRTLLSGARHFTVDAALTLMDGNVMHLTADDFKNGGIKTDSATSGTGKFDLGAAIMSKLSLTLNNTSGRFDEVDFTGARVSKLHVGVQLSGGIEYIPMGVFYVDSAKFSGTAVDITAYDALCKADRALPDSLHYPKSAGQMLRAICECCGIAAATSDFYNSDYTVLNSPGDITCREAVSYIAQLAGCFAKINREGELVLEWYGDNCPDVLQLDGGLFIDDSSGDTADGGDFFEYGGDSFDGGLLPHRGAFELNNAKKIEGSGMVEITGVAYTDSSEGNENKYIYGTEEYIFDLSDNPLIQHDAGSIVASIGGKLTGQGFSPLSISMSANPIFDTGDILHITDRRGKRYTGYINTVHYKYGSETVVTCEAESEPERQSAKYSAATRLERKINEIASGQLSEYSTRMQSLNDLIFNSLGVYKTAVSQADGSVIYYTHDCPNLTESSFIACETANGYAYTKNGWNNGMPQWQYGNTSDGNIICNTLNAVGIIADWIRTGRIESTDGSCYFDLDNNHLVADRVGASERHYAEMGEAGESVGMALYNRDVSDDPYFRVTHLYNEDEEDSGFGIYDKNNRLRVEVLENAGFMIYTADGHPILSASGTDESNWNIALHGGAMRSANISISRNGDSVWDSEVTITSPPANAAPNAIKVNSSGVYIIIDGEIVQKWEVD